MVNSPSSVWLSPVSGVWRHQARSWGSGRPQQGRVGLDPLSTFLHCGYTRGQADIGCTLLTFAFCWVKPLLPLLTLQRAEGGCRMRLILSSCDPPMKVKTPLRRPPPIILSLGSCNCSFYVTLHAWGSNSPALLIFLGVLCHPLLLFQNPIQGCLEIPIKHPTREWCSCQDLDW